MDADLSGEEEFKRVLIDDSYIPPNAPSMMTGEGVSYWMSLDEV
jgi:hypothetical protein